MPIARDGKYDELALGILLGQGADAAIVLIIGGPKGHGMSVASIDLESLERLPLMLRELANGIERDSKEANRIN